METFSALLAISAGNSPVPGEFPPQGQWRGTLKFSLICVWINGPENNCDPGDLRRYRVHHDVIVMTWIPQELVIETHLNKSEQHHTQNLWTMLYIVPP